MGIQRLSKHVVVSFHILYSVARAHPPAPSIVISTDVGAQSPSSQLLSALTDCESGWRGGTRITLLSTTTGWSYVSSKHSPVFSEDIFVHRCLYIFCLQKLDHRCTQRTKTCSENSTMFQKHLYTSANSLYTIIFIGCAIFHTLFNQFSMGGHFMLFPFFFQLKTVKHVCTDVLEPRSTDCLRISTQIRSLLKDKYIFKVLLCWDKLPSVNFRVLPKVHDNICFYENFWGGI